MVFRVFFRFLRVSWLVVRGLLLWMCLCKLCCVLVATPCCGALFTVAGKKTPLMMQIHVWLTSVSCIGMNYPRCVPLMLSPFCFLLSDILNLLMERDVDACSPLTCIHTWYI